jgi:hypothetical protein
LESISILVGFTIPGSSAQTVAFNPGATLNVASVSSAGIGLCPGLCAGFSG